MYRNVTLGSKKDQLFPIANTAPIAPQPHSKLYLETNRGRLTAILPR
ncbi:MAG: hypothetical protein WBA57_18825 [Elainellaceae cyanobacterium]